MRRNDKHRLDSTYRQASLACERLRLRVVPLPGREQLSAPREASYSVPELLAVVTAD
jgi:hypothetical protein